MMCPQHFHLWEVKPHGDDSLWCDAKLVNPPDHWRPLTVALCVVCQNEVFHWVYMM